MYFQASVGISIETGRIGLVYLKRSLRGVSLAGYAIYPLEKAEARERAVEIKKRVNAFLAAHQIPAADLFLGLPREAAILRYIELPLAVRENLRGTLGYEMEKYVPLTVSDIYFDFQIVAEDRAAGKMTVLLIVVRRDLIDFLLDRDDPMGAGISGVEITSTALINACDRDPGLSGGGPYAFAALADGRLELGLVQDRRLRYSRCLAVDMSTAAGENPIDRELDLLQKNLGKHEGPLTLAWCGPPGDGLAERLGQRTDVRVGPAEPAGVTLPSPFLIAAYGLALKGVRTTPANINLLPRDLRKKVSKTAYYTMFALAGLLLAAVLGWGLSQVLHQRHVAAGLASELRRLGGEVAAVQRTREQFTEIEGRLETLQNLRRRHVPALAVLQEMTRLIPSDAWLTRLYITDEKGDMEGFAASASALIPLLAASPLLKDVAFLSPITKEENGQERFRIGFALRRSPNPAPDEEAGK